MAFLPFLVSGLFKLLPRKWAFGYLIIVLLSGLGRARNVLDWDMLGWVQWIALVFTVAKQVGGMSVQRVLSDLYYPRQSRLAVYMVTVVIVRGYTQ